MNSLQNDHVYGLLSIPLEERSKKKYKDPEISYKEVLDWLKSLDYPSKFEVFMINDYQITQNDCAILEKSHSGQDTL